MSNIFQEFKSIQGYIGGYIFRPGSGILVKDMPTVYKENKLSELGEVLIKTYKSGSLNFSDMIDVSICFQEAIIIIRETSGNSFVFLFIDPSANMNLFNMTLSVMMDDIGKLEANKESESESKTEPDTKESEPESKTEPDTKESEPESKTEPDIKESEPQKPTPTPTKIYPKSVEEAKSSESKKQEKSASKLSVDDILNEGPLADELKEIQSALSDITGPIAKVILVDAVKAWTKDTEPSKESLPELAEILCKEINDPEKSEVFKKKLSHILESA